MNDKNDSVPESENNPIGFTEEDRAKLKNEFGKLGKTVGEATGMMFEGFAAMLEGFQAVLGEMKFHNFSDLIGSAEGEWRCEIIGCSVSIKEPELCIIADGKEAESYSCTVEVTDDGSTVKTDGKFGVFEYFEYYAPKLLDNGNIAPEYLLGVLSATGEVKHSIRFSRVKNESENNEQKKE